MNFCLFVRLCFHNKSSSAYFDIDTKNIIESKIVVFKLWFSNQKINDLKITLLKWSIVQAGITNFISRNWGVYFTCVTTNTKGYFSNYTTIQISVNILIYSIVFWHILSISDYCKRQKLFMKSLNIRGIPLKEESAR